MIQDLKIININDEIELKKEHKYLCEILKYTLKRHEKDLLLDFINNLLVPNKTLCDILLGSTCKLSTEELAKMSLKNIEKISHFLKNIY